MVLWTTGPGPGQLGANRRKTICDFIASPEKGLVGRTGAGVDSGDLAAVAGMVKGDQQATNNRMRPSGLRRR